jgi:hypothetical protein
MLARLLTCVAIAASAWGASLLRVQASETSVGNNFQIRGVACDTAGRCAPFRQRTRATTRLQCQTVAGMFGMAEWQSRHPALTVKEWHCAAPGEHNI